ncbi:MAG: 4-alpha-glucanotransferase [Elusimicrobiota bacterium]|jgi:4-alpha-glucanotransferase
MKKIKPKKQTAKVPSLQERVSGLLFHPTSLPGPYAIGDVGPAAYAFADFLAASGQRWWQVLPIGPLGKGNSPYLSFSAFAGNYLLISPELLARDGWLDSSDLASLHGPSHEKVDYEAARDIKQRCLWRAFDRFAIASSAASRRGFESFCRQEAFWLEDYALFSALRYHHPGKEWVEWETELRERHPKALAAARRDWARDIQFHRFVQWQFARQWKALRRYASQRGVGLIGDVPIFVSLDSADVWVHQNLFKLRPNGKPEVVAGVPPDYFSATGQLWGNPHYRWEAHQRQGYRWWLERLGQTFRFFEAVRIDHFIGFVRYYEVPGNALTAENGSYRPGPGAAFFKAIFRRMGPVQLIAEDLGKITPEVKTLRDQFHLPGMKVLQFAFGSDPEACEYLPHHYPPNAAVYTGTHDNDTTAGWFHHLEASGHEKERAFALQYLHSDGREIHWDMIRAAFQSVANTAIVPLQDVLGLGSDARMNRPGIAKGNWEWRLRPAALTPPLARRLRALARTCGRI